MIYPMAQNTATNCWCCFEEKSPLPKGIGDFLFWRYLLIEKVTFNFQMQSWKLNKWLLGNVFLMLSAELPSQNGLLHFD